MPRYLIKVSQPATRSRDLIDRSVRMIGSHFATQADWRLADGMATGTLVVDVEDPRRALAVVPPAMRSSARMDELMTTAEPAGSASAMPAERQAYLMAA